MPQVIVALPVATPSTVVPFTLAMAALLLVQVVSTAAVGVGRMVVLVALAMELLPSEIAVSSGGWTVRLVELLPQLMVAVPAATPVTKFPATLAMLLFELRQVPRTAVVGVGRIVVLVAA